MEEVTEVVRRRRGKRWQNSTAQHRSSAFFAPVLGETTNEPNGSLMVVVRATALPHLQYEGDLG